MSYALARFKTFPGFPQALACLRLKGREAEGGLKSPCKSGRGGLLAGAERLGTDDAAGATLAMTSKAFRGYLLPPSPPGLSLRSHIFFS